MNNFEDRQLANESSDQDIGTELSNLKTESKENLTDPEVVINKVYDLLNKMKKLEGMPYVSHSTEWTDSDVLNINGYKFSIHEMDSLDDVIIEVYDGGENSLDIHVNNNFIYGLYGDNEEPCFVLVNTVFKEQWDEDFAQNVKSGKIKNQSIKILEELINHFSLNIDIYMRNNNKFKTLDQFIGN